MIGASALFTYLFGFAVAIGGALAGLQLWRRTRSKRGLWITVFFATGFSLLGFVFCKVMITYAFFSTLESSEIESIATDTVVLKQSADIERAVMELRGVQIFLPNHNLERTELKMALTMKAKSTYVFRLFKLRDAPGTVICDEHGNSMLFVRELFAIH